MFSNLSRENDEKFCEMHQATFLGLNLDRIRSIFENLDDDDDELLVRSIEQVVEYCPELTQERHSINLLKYSVMQKTPPSVLSKLLQLCPISITRNEFVFKEAIFDCHGSPELQHVLEDYMTSSEADSIATNQSNNNSSSTVPELTAPEPAAVCVRHTVTSEDDSDPLCTIDDLQRIIELANPGDVVEIPEGKLDVGPSGSNVVSIKKPLQLIGAGMNKTRIKGELHLTATAESLNGGIVAISKLGIDGVINIEETNYKIITFLSVEVECPRSTPSDAFSVKCNGNILLNCCEIVGGNDGLCLTGQGTNATILETDIQLARSRGIFATRHFTIKDSVIYNCGGYGIKGRSGWTTKGENQIQPGPWNEYGAPSY